MTPSPAPSRPDRVDCFVWVCIGATIGSLTTSLVWWWLCPRTCCP